MKLHRKRPLTLAILFGALMMIACGVGCRSIHDYSPNEVHAEALRDAAAAIESGKLYMCAAGTYALCLPGVPLGQEDLVEDLPRKVLPSGCTNPEAPRSIAYAKTFNAQIFAHRMKR